jgi:hypothetical protein
VTIANIVAALKCHDEPPEADEPWIVCPSLLTIEDIVSDMCEGQYADSHQNAASKVKIPPKLWFMDVVLQKNVCLVFILQGFLVLHSRDHMEADL